MRSLLTRRSFPAVAVALLSAALISSGCGGDDDKSATTSPAAESSDAEAPLKIDEAKTALLAAGYRVKEEPGGPLIRNEASRGGLVVAEAQLTVTGGDLPSGTSVTVHSFSAPEDVAAVKRFAGEEGSGSFVKRELWFQSGPDEPGAADKVAEAATG